MQLPLALSHYQCPDKRKEILKEMRERGALAAFRLNRKAMPDGQYRAAVAQSMVR
jgi:hypothetical protein